KKSEENYRNFFNSNPLPTWIYDVETLEFLNVNEAAIIQYGYSREEFLRMTIKDIWCPEDVKKMDDLFVKHNKASGKSYAGNHRHIKKNGEIIYVDVESNAIEFNGRV